MSESVATQEVPDVMEPVKAGPPITRIVQDKTGKIIDKSYPKDISFQMSRKQEEEALALLAKEGQVPQPSNQKKQKVSPPKLERPDHLRRYLLAVCRLGSGRFEGLTEAELIDVVHLVITPVPTFPEWKEVTQRMEK